MNRPAGSYRRLLAVLLWLLVLCVSAHFLHDLQPDHSDLLGAGPSDCGQAIHIGVMMGLAPLVACQRIAKAAPARKGLFARFAALPVPNPPPIRGSVVELCFAA